MEHNKYLPPRCAIFGKGSALVWHWIWPERARNCVQVTTTSVAALLPICQFAQLELVFTVLEACCSHANTHARHESRRDASLLERVLQHRLRVQSVSLCEALDDGKPYAVIFCCRRLAEGKSVVKPTLASPIWKIKLVFLQTSKRNHVKRLEHSQVRAQVDDRAQ